MDINTQKMLYENSIDMEIVDDHIEKLLNEINKNGYVERLEIDIKNKKEYSGKSIDEVADLIDKEQQDKKENLDFISILKKENYYVVVGVKL